MKSIDVLVTKAHIRDGVRGDECRCPIALAVKDALLTDTVRVNTEGIYINDRMIPVDKHDLSFMEKFDSGGKVRPYQFSITRANRK